MDVTLAFFRMHIYRATLQPLETFVKTKMCFMGGGFFRNCKQTAENNKQPAAK